MIHEINSPLWPAFCQLLTQSAGANIKLEVIEPDGVKNVRVPSATLQDITFHKTDGCSDIIKLRLRNDREIVHEIIEPIKILLQPSGAGDAHSLQIEAESGITFLTINPPIHLKMLDGLKPQ